MEFLFLLFVAGLAASSISWLVSRRTDLSPLPGAPRYRVALSIGWYSMLAKSTWLAAPFMGLMAGILAAIPVALLISDLATPATEMRYIGPLFLFATLGGVVLGLRVGYKARRASLPNLEIYQDRVVIPVSGPLDAAVPTVIPFSELTSVSDVRALGREARRSGPNSRDLRRFHDPRLFRFLFDGSAGGWGVKGGSSA